MERDFGQRGNLGIRVWQGEISKDLYILTFNSCMHVVVNFSHSRR